MKKLKFKKLKKQLMENKKLLVFLCIVGTTIIIILGYKLYINIKLDQISAIPSINDKVDLRIINDLRVSIWSPISVVLYEDINYSNGEIEDKIISEFFFGEFILRHKLSSVPIFSGIITLSGLEKLINNPRVKSIGWDAEGSQVQ